MDGKLLKVSLINKNQLVDVSTFNSGFYLIIARVKNNTLTSSIVKHN